MENLVTMSPFWAEKKVLITGHTGFKGSWLSFWLNKMGANVSGYALEPPTDPSLYNLLSLDNFVNSRIADIRDLPSLTSFIDECQPEIVFHLAAQPIVRISYKDPVETYSTNIMGTVNVLEAIRHNGNVHSAVIITSDKCYENSEQIAGYTEEDPMGGFDPYSSSKGCSELVASSYARSFFSDDRSTNIASARAGNVIGGGDWGKDRIMTDIMQHLVNGTRLEIRNPNSIRPWQHVLEPLNGYLTLAEHLWDNGQRFQGGWNFGPDESEAMSVSWLVEKIHQTWGSSQKWSHVSQSQQHEANFLRLNCKKAHDTLNWRPRLTILDGVKMTAEWYKSYRDGEDLPEVTNSQIEFFLKSSN